MSKIKHNEIRDYIEMFYKKYDKSIVCTDRILEALANTIHKMFVSDQIKALDEVDQLLESEKTVRFIKDREPYIEKVPPDVLEKINAFFRFNLAGFKVLEVCRSSNHKLDKDLYSVIGKQDNGKYACWTSYNAGLNTLNYGHYGLKTEEEAFVVINDNFNDIAGNKDLFGPAVTKIPVTDNITDYNRDQNISGKENLVSSKNRRVR